MNESEIRSKPSHESSPCPGCGRIKKIRIRKDQTRAQFECPVCTRRWSYALPGQRLDRAAREEIFMNQEEPGTGFPFPSQPDSAPAPVRRTIGQRIRETIQKLIR